MKRRFNLFALFWELKDSNFYYWQEYFKCFVFWQTKGYRNTQPTHKRCFSLWLFSIASVIWAHEVMMLLTQTWGHRLWNNWWCLLFMDRVFSPQLPSWPRHLKSSHICSWLVKKSLLLPPTSCVVLYWDTEWPCICVFLQSRFMVEWSSFKAIFSLNFNEMLYHNNHVFLSILPPQTHAWFLSDCELIILINYTFPP